MWAPADGAADIGGTGVGTLLSRFAGLDLAVQKQVADQTGVSLVDVRGGTGLLLSGPGHTVVFRTSAGEFREEATRRSTNALLWNEGGNVYRLEAALDAAALLRLAESLDLAG